MEAAPGRELAEPQRERFPLCVSVSHGGPLIGLMPLTCPPSGHSLQQGDEQQVCQVPPLQPPGGQVGLVTELCRATAAELGLPPAEWAGLKNQHNSCPF